MFFKTYIFVICFLYSLSGVSQLSGVYTVGVSGDYLDVISAMEDLNAVGVSGPVIIEIEPGIYNGVHHLDHVSGVSDINTITFTSSDLDSSSVTLRRNTGSYVVYVEATPYVRFNHISIQRTNTCTKAVHFSGICTNAEFINCQLLGPSTTTGNLVYFETAGNSNVLFENNLFFGGGYPIEMHAAGSDNRIINNLFEGSCRTAILLEDQNDFEISGNTIRGKKFSTQITIKDCFSGLIEKNHVYTESLTFTHLGLSIESSDGTELNPIIVRNNFFQGNGATAVNLNIISSQGIKVYNNNFNNNCFEGNDMIQISSSSNVYIYNNAFRSDVTRIFECYTLIDSSEVHIDYNAYYTEREDTLNFEYVDGQYYSFKQWQDSLGFDLHSVWADPNFLTDTNLHINNAIALNQTGIMLDDVIDDYDDELRNPVTTDIGADEFDLDSTTYYDLAIVEILYPDTSICELSDSIALRIASKSNFDINNFVIEWSTFGLQQDSSIYEILVPALDTITVSIESFSFVKNTGYNLRFELYYPDGETDNYELDNVKGFTYYYLDDWNIYSRNLDPCSDEVELFIKNFPRESVLWSTGETEGSVIVSEPGIYEVEVTDYRGCVSSNTITVE